METQGPGKLMVLVSDRSPEGTLKTVQVMAQVSDKLGCDSGVKALKASRGVQDTSS